MYNIVIIIIVIIIFVLNSYDDLTTGQSDRHWRAHTNVPCDSGRERSKKAPPPPRTARVYVYTRRERFPRAHTPPQPPPPPPPSPPRGDLPFSSLVRFYCAIPVKRVAARRHRHRRRRRRVSLPRGGSGGRGGGEVSRRRRRGRTH